MSAPNRPTAQPWIVLALLAVLTTPAYGAADPPPADSFTIAVLPDTQHYSQSYPGIFNAQTNWIRLNAAAHDIRFVLHLGDVTNKNTAAQWDNAKTAMSLLDGNVPYAICPGNHDYGPNGDASTRDSLFNLTGYFGPGSPYILQPTVGGVFEGSRTDNTYHLFEAGGRKWIVLALEWGPRAITVAWAKQVLNAFPDRTAIVITHAYLFHDDAHYDWSLQGTSQGGNPHSYGTASLPGGVHDGRELFDELITHHRVAMVLSGHVTGDGTGRRISIKQDGRIVHQMLSNYQSGVDGSINGGNGYMRLLQFLEDGHTVRVRSYSPVTDQYKTEADQEFSIGLAESPVPGSPAQAMEDASSLLYWRLDQFAGPAVENDSYGQSALDGTYSGPGPDASFFDGAGSEVTSNAAVPALATWSLHAWARPSAATPGVVLSNDRPGANDDVTLRVLDAGGGAGHYAVVHEDAATGAVTTAEANLDVVAGRWSHLVATGDGETLTLYVDGELAAEVPRAGADLALGAAAVRAGRSFVGAGDPWLGRIAEVALIPHALHLGEVAGVRLAAHALAQAALIEVTSPVDPGDNSAVSALASGDLFPGLRPGEGNEGDLRIQTTPHGLNVRDGVLIATPRRHQTGGLVASIEASWSTFGDGVIALSTTEVGYMPGAAGTNEINADAALAWFPFRGGFIGGHIQETGDVLAGSGLPTGAVSPTDTGRFHIDLGVDSRQDGFLFAIGGDNDDNIATTAVLPDGGGWDVRLLDSGGDLADDGGAGEDGKASFVYLPRATTHGLIAGRYDGELAVMDLSTGGPSMQRLAAGQYRLTIPSLTPADGSLILCGARYRTKSGVTAPEDNLLTYEDDATGGFLIRSRDLPALALQDTTFAFAFVPFGRGFATPFVAYGAGCPGSTATSPRLSVSGALTPSGVFSLVGEDLSAHAPALLAIGADRAKIPLGGGCAVLCAPLLGVVTGLAANSGGELALTAAVPPVAAGLSITAQLFGLDPNAPAGVAASNGVAFEFP